MASESDISRDSLLSATEASRSFSRVLDQVEAGRRFVVRRRGRDVCLIAPAPIHGRRASECLALLRGRPSVVLDDSFGEDVLGVISEEPVEERSTWDY